MRNNKITVKHNTKVKRAKTEQIQTVPLKERNIIWNETKSKEPLETKDANKPLVSKDVVGIEKFKKVELKIEEKINRCSKVENKFDVSIINKNSFDKQDTYFVNKRTAPNAILPNSETIKEIMSNANTVQTKTTATTKNTKSTKAYSRTNPYEMASKKLIGDFLYQTIDKALISERINLVWDEINNNIQQTSFYHNTRQRHGNTHVPC